MVGMVGLWDLVSGKLAAKVAVDLHQTSLRRLVLHWSRYRHHQQCHAVPCCAMLCLPALAKKHRSLLAFDKQGVNCSVNCSEFS